MLGGGEVHEERRNVPSGDLYAQMCHRLGVIRPEYYSYSLKATSIQPIKSSGQERKAFIYSTRNDNNIHAPDIAALLKSCLVHDSPAPMLIPIKNYTKNPTRIRQVQHPAKARTPHLSFAVIRTPFQELVIDPSPCLRHPCRKLHSSLSDHPLPFPRDQLSPRPSI